MLRTISPQAGKPGKRCTLYEFRRINHAAILTHAVLIGLTPLIPIPIVDDWVKGTFQRALVRQITGARGLKLTSEQIEALIQDNFWDGCVEGCIGVIVYILRELASKILFFLEWRRAFNLVGQTYYTGFLLDAALLDGYPLAGENGSTVEAERLREAIRRARYGANLRLIQRLFREALKPFSLLGAAGPLVKRAVASLPRLLASLPGVAWRGLRAAPGQVARGVGAIPRRILNNVYLRVQVLLGKEKPPEVETIRRIVQSMQAGLEKMDPAHFNELHARLVAELESMPGSRQGEQDEKNPSGKIP